ncbi:MAG: DUF5684 domain-containing protein [Acidobacteriota bacterium]
MALYVILAVAAGLIDRGRRMMPARSPDPFGVGHTRESPVGNEEGFMQSTPDVSPVFFLFFMVFGLAIYLFYSYCLKRIVEKCGEQPGLIIWIPILQMLPLFRIAKMNPWLILLMFIPLANLIVAVMVWLGVLKVLGRDPLMVVVALVFGFIYIPYLAFSSDRTPARAAV